MKILFYDVSDFEFDYFLDNSIKTIEKYFFKIPLNNKTYVDKKYADCEAISTFVDSFLDKETLSKFKNLKFIFLRCTGYSNVDLKYCSTNGINVFNVPEYGTNAVSEFAFGLILNISRNIIEANSNLKLGQISKVDSVGFELYKKTLGVIGAGSIGKRVLDIAKAFNMNTLAYDTIENSDYNYVTLDELLKKSDFIVICCSLNSETKHLINRSAFLKMKKNAYLINVSRGEVVEIQSLYDAIITKRIQGAALDVVECEETLCAGYRECIKKDNIKSNCLKKYLFITKLMQLKNVIITPHIAYNTHEARKKLADITIENIKSSFNINSGTKNLVLI